MGMFGRLGTLIRSNINELINKAEDPEKMLNQVLVDMKTQLVEAKKQVAVAIADEKRLKKQYQNEAGKAAEWERKAMLAVKAGDDNLARAALRRKGEHDITAAEMGKSWEAQKKSVEQLKAALRGLDNKIEEAKRKRNILVSRQKRAEAQRTINETLSSISGNNSFETFDRMADRVMQLEAEAEASAELGALPEATLESEFRALEAGDVDNELEALKEKMALGSAKQDPKAIEGEQGPAAASGETPPDEVDGATAAAEVDAKLDELKRKLNT
jgi:phage shock protein A